MWVNPRQKHRAFRLLFGISVARSLRSVAMGLIALSLLIDRCDIGTRGGGLVGRLRAGGSRGLAGDDLVEVLL